MFRVVEKNAQSAQFEVPDSGVEGLDKSAVLQKVMKWRQTEQDKLESVCRLVSHFVARCGDVQSGQ